MSQTTIGLPNQTNLTVMSTPGMAMIPANPTRNGLIVANNGADTVNMTFGPTHTPSATSGIPLAAAGSASAVFTLIPRNESVALGAQINFIAAADDTPVSVLEF